MKPLRTMRSKHLSNRHTRNGIPHVERRHWQHADAYSTRHLKSNVHSRMLRCLAISIVMLHDHVRCPKCTVALQVERHVRQTTCPSPAAHHNWALEYVSESSFQQSFDDVPLDWPYLSKCLSDTIWRSARSRTNRRQSHQRTETRHRFDPAQPYGHKLPQNDKHHRRKKALNSQCLNTNSQ